MLICVTKGLASTKTPASRPSRRMAPSVSMTLFISSTMLQGRFVLRFCVVSFRTHEEQMAHAVEDVRSAARELVGKG